jgi:NADPH:quinone reductase-like Zn-dependent oxidoreductase
MKAFVVERYGDSEGTRMAEVFEPVPAAGEVLVRIHAASLNPIDYKTREGKVKAILPYQLPFILGSDLAGVVEGVGPGVMDFKVGDEVYGRASKMRIGSFAEAIAINEADIAPKPASLDMCQAASIPLVGLTAWQAFVDRAKLRPGQKVLIHAGSGGVGTLAIQIASQLGALVATTTSTPNVDWVKKLGAKTVIDYRKQDFTKLIRDYDIVLDTLGGSTLAKSVGVLRSGGKIVSIAGPPDTAFAKEIGANPLLTLAMFLMSLGIKLRAGARGVDYEFFFMRPSGEQLRELTKLIEAGKLKPVVDRVLPFSQAKAAFDYLEKGHAKGKIVLKMK